MLDKEAEIKMSSSKFFILLSLIFSHISLFAAPQSVTNLTALAGNATINLTWSPNTDINTGDKYEIEFSSWSASSFTFLTNILHPGNTHQVLNLINGNTYFFRVRASTGAGTFIGPWSDVRSTAPWVNLGIPQWSLADTRAVSTTTINWSWLLAANASGYRVINSTSGENFSGNLSASATFWQRTGLTPNTSAAFYIQAFNGLLTANSSDRRIFSWANPPSNFMSPLQPGTTIVNLDWSPNNNPSSVSYSLERSSTDVSNWQLIASFLTSTTHQDPGLLEKTTYHYRVWAINSDSIETDKVSVSTRTGSINPQPPTLMLAESWTLDGEVRLTFTAPYDDSPDESVKGYIIKYATYALTEPNWSAPSSSTAPQNITPSAPGTGQTHVITGLYPGTTFFFAMKSVDEVENESGISVVQSTVARDNLPSLPTNISALAISETGITISWTLPAFLGFDDRSRYYVYRATFPFTLTTQATFFTWQSHPNASLTDSSIDNPLRRETTYWYRVASEDLGNGPAGSGLFSIPLGSTTLSEMVSARTPDLTPPPAITTLSALTGNIEGRINLSWTSPTDNSIRLGEGAGENITGGRFRIRWTTDAAEIFSTATFKVEIPTNTFPGAMNNYLITGLAVGDTYYIRIWTADESGNWSLVSNGATTWAQWDVTAPGAITSITASANWRRINLSWTAPGDDGYLGVMTGKFEIRLSTVATITNETIWNAVPDFEPYRIIVSTSGVSPGSIRYFVITGLTNSATYFVAIKSADERDNWSAISSTSPASMPLNLPPGNFNLSSPPDGSQLQTLTPQLTWEAASDGDIPFGDSIRYNVLYSTSVNFEVAITTISPDLSGATYIVPSGHFLEDRRYFWRVVASDLDNSTRFSAQTFSAVINVMNSTPTAPVLSSPPTNTRINTATPQLNWVASTDSDLPDILSYRVDYSLTPDFSVFVSSLNISTTFYTTPQLLENTTYWWRVFVSDGQLTVQSGATFYFRVNAVAEAPSSFNLLTPTDNVRFATTTINFTWETTTDPDPDESVRYDLIWSQFATFSTSTTVSGLTNTTAQIVLPHDNSYYYWKVEAVGTDGLKRPSNQSFLKFYTDIVKELPLAFNLIEPGFGVIISTTLRPIFIWSDAIDPDPADIVRYYIEMSPNSDFAGAIAIPTGSDTFYRPLSNLSDQTTYFWRVRAAGHQGSPADNVDGGWTFSTTGFFVISMVNYPPGPFELISPNNGEIINTKSPTFKWQASVDSDVGSSVSYSIYISTSSDFSTLSYSSRNITSTQIAIAQKLFENKAYFWRIVARDNRDALTASTTFSFFIPVLTIPQRVAGIRAYLSPAATSYTLMWSETIYNADGSIIDDLKGYNIYKSLSIAELKTSPLHIFVEKNTPTFTDIVSGNFFYKVLSVDTSGIESEDSLITRTLNPEEVVVKSPDGLLTAEIPPSTVKQLHSENNQFKNNLILFISTHPTDTALRQFAVEIIKPNGDKIGRHTFPEAVKLRFENKKLKASSRNVSALGDNDVGLYWYNGIEFMKMPSHIESGGTISNIANTGTYQIRQVKKTSTQDLISISPPKVFTPDIAPYEKIQFFVENAAGDKVKGEVFDIRGRKIAALKILGDSSATTVNLVWDGKDDENRIVSKGIYIYQISIGEKIINGTIVAAR